MRDELLHYYERELSFLRRTGAEFGRRYPKIAGRLQMEPSKCDDPHVERLLEGFALLAARVHLRIDDDLPELSEALLNVVYPHHVRPLPSVATAQFHPDPEQGKLSSGLKIPRGTTLYSQPVAGSPCRFRTCYDTTIWPVEVRSASWAAPQELDPPVRGGSAVAALKIELECGSDLTFSELGLTSLRFFLSGESALTATLFELLDSRCSGILFRDPTGAVQDVLHGTAADLRPVGFSEDETLLPASGRGFAGFGLLQEYFYFPDKFLYFDLDGFDRVRARGFGSRLEVIVLISSFERADRKDRLQSGVDARTIRLGATPIVNLFQKTSEPILLSQRRPEYVVVPDARRRETTGVFSVDEVVAVSPGNPETVRFEPFQSFRHGMALDEPHPFWIARRRPRTWRTADGTEVHLSFVDLSARTVYPDEEAVTLRLTCHNGELPSRLPFGSEQGDFHMQDGGQIKRITTLSKPTSIVEPPLGTPLLWRLVSQLSLNYVSLIDGGGEGLRELLRLHNSADSAAAERQIQGVLSISGQPCHAPLTTSQGIAFARGHRIELEVDEEQFVGGGAYVFASVMERFLALYAPLNSFSILTARTRQRKEVLREWAPRAGTRPLL